MRSAVSARPCVVCGATDRRVAVSVGEWTVGRCRCGTHTLSPEPPAPATEGFDDGTGYDEAFALREPILAQHQRSLAVLERHVERGRLLDAGCGPGLLLEAARDRGWTCVAADGSAWSVEHARALGFEASLGMIEDLDMPAGSFDAVALLQVVEHVLDPRPLLSAVHRLLRPGGALLIATPNPASLLARATRERFNYWIPPVHVAWYAPRALTRLLASEGFRVAERTTWSARTAGLHDGLAVLDAVPGARRLPYRLKRRLADAVVGAADAAKRGTITEQVAVRTEDA